MSTSVKAAVLGLCCLAAAGCQTANNTTGGAIVGTGLGAATGALIGDASGHAGGGALIGAAAGAVTGGLLGNAADAREERDAAIANAQYSQAQTRAVLQAVTVSEVIRMSQSGISDDVIVNAVRTRGCQFDGSPATIIHLSQQGVSEKVIETMQQTGLKAPAVSYPAPVVYAPPPPPMYGPPGVVVIGPRYPRPYWGPRYYGPYGRHW